MRALTLTLLLLLSFTCKEITAQCYDYANALDISARTSIECKIINNTKEPTPPVVSPPPPPSLPASPPPPSSPPSPSPSSSSSKTTTVPTPSASVFPPFSSLFPLASVNVPHNFIINYKCEIEANQALCTKAQQSIEKVCEILKSNLNLITDINVDVTLRNLCPTDTKQPCNELGGATFARTMELLDDDNVIREYPSTLVKQFDCEQHYEFGDIDIRAIFNGGNATSLWFEGDPPITTDQKDFRIIVLKEFIKALGVQTSLLEQSMFVNVTPKILTPQLTLTENSGGLEFKGFNEYAFDKYMVLRGKQVQPISESIKSLNDFAKVPDNNFKDQQEFVTKFVQSQQIGVAQNMANLSVTQFTLGFQPRGSKSDDDIIILETLLNPYQNGVSVNNFDASVYAATDDFLMTSPIKSGKTLEDSTGKFPSPLGPKLISLLETLGYPTKRLPNNNFKVCNIPPPSPPSPTSPSSTVTTAVTTSVTTQITTTVPVIVTTTIQQDNTNVVSTQTQNVVTKIESVSRSIVTTVVVVDVPQSQPTTSPINYDDPFQGGIDSSSSSLKNNQNNFILIIFISLIVCIIGSY